jgi:NarL family two-component system response regulator LiaR
MTKDIRVLIVDDHPIVREGLRGVLSREPGLEVVGEAANGFEAVEKARSLRPDLILLDLMMPRKDGLAALGEIKQDDPDACVLILTSFAEDDKIFPAIKAGAQGYLLKDSTPETLLQAIQDAYRGESPLHPSIARKVIRELNRSTDLPPTEDPLTTRELEVLRLMARGLPNRDISEKLYISESTVRVHVRNILGKLHLANRTQAALYALQEGLADLD